MSFVMARVAFVLGVLLVCLHDASASSCTGADSSKCAIRDRLTVTFSVGGTDTREAVFTPRVDEFSVLELYEATAVSGQNINLSVTVGGDTSNTKIWSDGSNYVGVFILVIEWDDGKVDNIKWKDTCDGGDCTIGDHSCVDGNCADSAKEDPKVFLSHVGNDKDGTVMTSYDLVPTRYTSYSIGDVYGDMKKA